MDRRRALAWIVRGIGVATVGSVVGPAVASLVSPLFRRQRGENWRPIGPLDDFPVTEMRKAVVSLPEEQWTRTVGARGVFVWRREADEIIVFSRSCTDLGCPITWDAGSQWFFCPCHGGIFNKSGQPVAGPPARPLYRYRTRVRDGVLEVDLHSVPPMV